MAVLFREHFAKNYMAKATSGSSLICYFFMIVAFVLPLILVTRTHSIFF